ncbi:hypothetical protein F8M41_010781 [Gigaspora margarita]|uniref:Uncharacterized protein n=1 Tax=Gigaspora margarita TaxID=4874 RepID=A0A8H4A2Z7_GIGMA|nr:hypothetical protein F8M41_010781 [Gigaspora margarita]
MNIEIRTFVTMPIVNKIREQMNYSFLYYAKESAKYVALEKAEEVDCETSCLDEIFDLPQRKDQVYNDDISNRCFVRLGSSNNDSLYFFPTKWAPISSNNSHGFSDREIELVHSHLKEKQRYAKIFELANTLRHQNYVDIVLDNENTQSNIVDHQNNIVLEKENVYKYCGEYGHSIRSCKKKQDESESEDSSKNSELKKSSMNLKLEDNENISNKRNLKRAESSSTSSESENNKGLMQK